MGGVRGDVIALDFVKTTIMEIRSAIIIHDRRHLNVGAQPPVYWPSSDRDQRQSV